MEYGREKGGGREEGKRREEREKQAGKGNKKEGKEEGMK